MCTLARTFQIMDFEDVLSQFEPMIHACLRKLHIYKNHDSFIQVGRIGLWKAWKGYDPEKGDFAPYAYRSIYGSLLDELKKVTVEEQVIPAEDQTLEFMLNKQDHQTLEWSQKSMEALAKMNQQEQQLIHLLFMECYSLDEAAIHLGITKANVKKRRQRTLGKLKQILLD